MQVDTAFVYTSIAFAMVFFVLGGMTFKFFGSRHSAGEEISASAKNVVSAEKAAATQVVVGVKSHHVAAITAAVLAATQGRGKILSIVPAAHARDRIISSETTRMWRTAAIIGAVGRRLPPSWKR